jgi:hypothetical protein
MKAEEPYSSEAKFENNVSRVNPRVSFLLALFAFFHLLCRSRLTSQGPRPLGCRKADGPGRRHLGGHRSGPPVLANMGRDWPSNHGAMESLIGHVAVKRWECVLEKVFRVKSQGMD